MLKKLLYVVLFISFTVQSQNFVKGKIEPVNDYSWVVLYQLKGAKQLYIKNTTIDNGEFSIEMPQNASKGMYRLLYSQDGNGYIDFIYNNEQVELKYNPEEPILSLAFVNSEENKIYNSYKSELAFRMQELDSVQLSYFKLTEESDKKIASAFYENSLSDFKNFQNKFEKKSEGTLANHFIKSSEKYYSNNLVKTPQQYLNSEKLHYFDFINFNDEVLSNSIFFSGKIIDYVFYLNGSDDVEVQNKLYMDSVQMVLNRIENSNLKSEMITTLLYTFSQIENTILIDFLIDKFYNNLPESVKNDAVIKEIQEKVKLAVGKTAPEFTWEERGTTKKLSSLREAENYIVVFWSTGCSHCLVEIPKLYEFIKDNKETKVIAIALENDELDFNHHTSKFKKWTNVLGLNKWQNEIARSYEITSTPTYFVLDKNKKIIAKPDYFEDVKSFFNN